MPTTSARESVLRCSSRGAVTLRPASRNRDYSRRAAKRMRNPELVEVTPSSLRLRKRVLSATARNAIRKREALGT